MTREWNGDEITQLRSLAGTQSARQIALVLGRTRHAVKQQMKRLRICVDRAPEWTPTEIEQLRELARTKSCMQASMELKRGRTSVHWKAAQLGVVFAKKTPRVKESKKALRFWTLEERSLLREMAPKLSMHELARVTGRSVSAVEHMTAKLGLQVAYSKPKPVKAEKSNTRKPVAGGPRRIGPGMITVPRIVYCEACSAPVVGTHEGWAKHYERVGCNRKAKRA